MLKSPSSQSGLSLIEIMVALAVGLFLLGAAGSLGLSSLRASKEGVVNSHTQREMQTVISLATRELRRAGYNRNDESNTAADTERFRKIWFFGTAPNFNCVIFRYDRTPETASPPGNGSWMPGGVFEKQDIRGLRLNTDTNRVELLVDPAQADATPANCPQSGWEPIASDVNLQVTGFTITPPTAPNIGLLVNGDIVVDYVRIGLNATGANGNSASISETVQLRNRPIQQ